MIVSIKFVFCHFEGAPATEKSSFFGKGFSLTLETTDCMAERFIIFTTLPKFDNTPACRFPHRKRTRL